MPWPEKSDRGPSIWIVRLLIPADTDDQSTHYNQEIIVQNWREHKVKFMGFVYYNWTGLSLC